MTGIEPAFSAWEADVLPLNYTREGTARILARILVHALPEGEMVAGPDGMRSLSASRSSGAATDDEQVSAGAREVRSECTPLGWEGR